MGLGILLSVVAIVCAVWVIYDVLINNRRLSTGMKLFWIICAVFFSIITAVIYYFIGRDSRNDLFRNRLAR